MDGQTHPAALPVEALLAECDVKTTRASGPGGQHRNKVESAVVITHRPTQIIGQASEQRSQHENRKRAIRRLRLSLAVAFRTENKADTVSESWRSRVISKRIVVSVNHEDFPGLLAEAMDMVADKKWEVNAAASALGCSTSQLIKFLKLLPEAFVFVNRERERHGLSKLR